MAFILGMLSFFISQIILRIPLLKLLSQEASFQVLMMNHYLAMGFVIALSAGVFEETTRYLIKRFLLIKERSLLREALIFGLGHGLMEAGYILSSLLLTYPLVMLIPALLERLLAILLHISFSIIVWKGFLKKQEIKYLVLAIFVHGLVDFSIPLGQYFESTALSLALILLISSVILGYAIYSIKDFREEK